MKRLGYTIVLIFCFQISYANLLYDIVDGKYKIKAIEMPRSMKDGENYTVMLNEKAVVKYNYITGDVVDTIFSISKLKNSPIKQILGYELSPNESKLLVYCNMKKRYRRTFTAEYYVYDIKRNEIEALSENGAQEVPLFSPDSRYIAFAREK
jgi:dipeptidyl-peptidase-4